MAESPDQEISYKASDTYTRPEGPFNNSYVTACEINYGMSRAGAEKHYQLMQMVPDGFRYHGKVPADYNLDIYPRETCIIATETYDLDGNPQLGYVAIAMKSE